MRDLTFDDFQRFRDYILTDTLVENHDMGSRWFEAEMAFTMNNAEYVQVLRSMGFNVVDSEDKEIGHPIRPSWDEYFLGIADAVSKRGDCSRRQVGAVVVDKDNRIVSSGYNGSPPGGPSCLAGECPRATSGVEPFSSYDTGPGACIASHAESNALLYAGRAGTKGSVLYITTKPCDGCLKLIKASGVKKVVWPDGQLTKKDLYG